ncbi:MAG TPA: hypothetical protein VMI75_04790 [Polyangiaceae bacterium]|nr:hypothetical protein [Polyangiaceae bacterium]
MIARGVALASCCSGSRMPIAYSATTDGATFLLDEFGVCRRVLLKHAMPGQHTMGGRTRSQAARAIVGAQYVASIDTRVFGGLVPMPKPGAAMLFAYMGDDGRLAVVRTGPLVKFETLTRPLADDTMRDYEDYDDDEAMTAPLNQSGERSTPVVSILIEDEWSPPEPPPTWPTLTEQQTVRIPRKSDRVPKSESAPTLKMLDTGVRGRNPRRAGRG